MFSRTVLVWTSAAFATTGLAYIAYSYFRPKETVFDINVNDVQHKRITNNYCPVPSELVEHILKEGWRIIEMGGGTGENARILRDSDIDIISYDLRGSSKVKQDSEATEVRYGLCGTVEAQYPDRTLFLAQAYEAERSIQTYTEAGGKRVILGGKIQSNNYKTVYVVESLSTASDFKEVLVPDCPHKKDSETEMYLLLTRPNYGWMQRNGWFLKGSYVGCKDDFNTGINVYGIWERET